MPVGRPAISILLPVYNGALYLPEQIDSILAQTHRDFELLIHNDGSTDGSGEILRRAAAGDSRIMLSSETINSGQKFVLRELLSHARGDLIMFSDQDDVWLPDKTAKLVAALGDASLAFGTSQLIDAEGTAIGRTIFDHVGPPLSGRNQIDFLFRTTVSGHALLARREVIDPGLFMLDQPFDWLIGVVATFSAGVVHVPDAIVCHRQHADNQLNTFRIGTRRQRRHPTSRRQQRLLRLHDALALLRMAPTVAPEKRRAFAKLHQAILVALKSGASRSMFDGKLAQDFADALAALHIPPAEQLVALKAFAKICRGPLHPKTLRDAFVARLAILCVTF